MSKPTIAGEVLSLSEGEFSVQWPQTLSVRSFMAISDYLEGLRGRILDHSGISAQELLVDGGSVETDVLACNQMREIDAPEWMINRFLIDERAFREKVAGKMGRAHG